MPATLLQLPVANVQDVPGGLRRLASQIETGEYGDVYNLMWVVDRGDNNITMGLLGACAEPGAVGYHLLGVAMRKLDCL